MADTLSTRIRRARRDAEMTREEMAPKLGVALRTLSRYETGETQRISAETLAKIAAVTGKSLAYFLAAEEAAA